MKVVFFDIDGVLNTPKTHNPHKLPYVVDKNLVKRFRKLLANTRAKGVIASSWRYDPAGIYSAKLHGIPFVGCIPDMPRRSRRDEIVSWLRQHPRVTRFAVLDDDDDELDELPLFQPNPKTGLTAEMTRRLTAYLIGKTDKDMRRNVIVRMVRNMTNVVTGHNG